MEKKKKPECKAAKEEGKQKDRELQAAAALEQVKRE